MVGYAVSLLWLNFLLITIVSVRLAKQRVEIAGEVGHTANFHAQLQRQKEILRSLQEVVNHSLVSPDLLRM